MPILPVILNEFALAGLFALFLIKLLNNPKIKNYYLFWILGILICLYKLDVGYGALLSGIVIYFIFNKVLNNKFEYKQLVKSAIIVVLPMLLFFHFVMFNKINQSNFKTSGVFTSCHV